MSGGPAPGPRVDPEPDAGPEPSPPPADEPRSRLRWWKEVLYIAAFYAVYTFIRNTQGSASVSEATAMANALEVIRAEEALHIYVEEQVQEAFLGWPWFIELWNVFYGTFHFVVTIVALVLLFRRFPDRYPRWRNTLAFTTALALIGFAAYPLLPPRLLPASYGYVDTLRAYGSLWSFESGAVNKLSNQYAAMPSLHFAWAVWSSLVLAGILRRPWARVLAVGYPVATLFAIVVTGNHYILDAAGGLAVLGVGALAGFALAARTGVNPVREPVSNPR